MALSTKKKEPKRLEALSSTIYEVERLVTLWTDALGGIPEACCSKTSAKALTAVLRKNKY